VASTNEGERKIGTPVIGGRAVRRDQEDLFSYVRMGGSARYHSLVD